MEATGTGRAVIVSLSRGAQRALLLAAEHPDRVAGAVFIAPAVPLAGLAGGQVSIGAWGEELGTDEGWAKCNRYYWLRDYRGFLEFFFSQMFTEPHSTKATEDCVGWGLDTTAETLVATELARHSSTRRQTRELCRRVRCPVLVIQGTDDAITGQGLRDRARRGDGRPARPARGLGPRPARARPGQGESAPARLRRPAAPAAAPTLGTRQGTPQAGALHLLADRPRPRPARRRRSPTSCASCIPACRSTGSPSIRSPECWRRAASASTPPARYLASESGHIESESAEHDLHAFQALPPDGRDPARQLHGLPRRRRARATTTCGSATRPGSSTTTCTRTRS